MPNSYAKKYGFTLVELSIVLVIIGLLIGGILVAQSMITTAKIGTFIRLSQQFDTAVYNFETKYNSLPGDSSAMGCVDSSSNTCDNGIIEDNYCNNCTADGGANSSNFNGEAGDFWVHLGASGFEPSKSFTATVPANGFDINSNTPNSPAVSLDVNNTGIVVITVGTTPRQKAAYWFADFTGIDPANDTNIYGAAAAFKPATALAIDTKIDDGINNKGIVMGWDPGGSLGGPLCVTAPGKYKVSTSVPSCVVSIKVLGQTSN